MINQNELWKRSCAKNSKMMKTYFKSNDWVMMNLHGNYLRRFKRMFWIWYKNSWLNNHKNALKLNNFKLYWLANFLFTSLSKQKISTALLDVSHDIEFTEAQHSLIITHMSINLAILIFKFYLAHNIFIFYHIHDWQFVID